MYIVCRYHVDSVQAMYGCTRERTDVVWCILAMCSRRVQNGWQNVNRILVQEFRETDLPKAPEIMPRVHILRVLVGQRQTTQGTL